MKSIIFCVKKEIAFEVWESDRASAVSWCQFPFDRRFAIAAIVSPVKGLAVSELGYFP